MFLNHDGSKNEDCLPLGVDASAPSLSSDALARVSVETKGFPFAYLKTINGYNSCDLPPIAINYFAFLADVALAASPVLVFGVLQLAAGRRRAKVEGE